MSTAALHVMALGPTLRGARRYSREHTWLYFVQVGGNGPVKIGESRDPRARLRNMQVNNHESLSLRAVRRVIPGAEVDLHQALERDRLRGEWFAPSVEVLATVAAFAAEPDNDWFKEDR